MTRVQAGTLVLICLSAVWSGCNRSPEARRDKHVAQGKEFLHKKDYSRAILEFKNALQAMPKDADVYYQLSLGYWAVDDVRMAIGSLRKALELNPKHVEAQLRMAQIMSMASDPALVKDAEQRLAKMLEEAPDNADTLHALAFTELKLGEPENAIEHLGRAMVLAPNDIMMAVSMAQAKLQQQDAQGAEQVLRKAVQNSPKSANAAVMLGTFYLSQKRWPEAEQELQRALSLEPNNGQALLDLAKLQNSLGRKGDAEQNFKRLSALPDKTFKPVYAIFLFQEGRRDEAIRKFENLAKEDPEDRQARVRLIAAYRTAEREADAEKVLDQALKKNPKDADALLQRGEMFIVSAKYDRAEMDLNQVLRLRPDSAEVHYVLAKLHQARGESRIYREELLKALQLDPTLLAVRVEAIQDLLASNNAKAAMSLLNETPSFEKDLSEVLAQRNWVLWALGDMGEMRKGIDRGLLLGRTPEFLVQDGAWNLHAGKFAAARASLEEALKINPDDLRALSALNQSYVAQKQNGTALQKVKEYAARQPKSAPIQEFLGVLLMANGQRQEARQAFVAAQAADRKFVQADLSLVQTDIVDGRLDEAQRRLEGLLVSNPSNETARFWLGNVEITRGNHKAALEHLRRVVEANPNNAQALNNYAYLLTEFANQPGEALKYAQKAKELSPGDAAYGDTLGWILYRKGLYPMAVSELERAAANGEDPIRKYHLAMAYVKAGNLDRGRTTLQRALQLNPNLAEAKMAQQVVEAATR
jgi:tetratricopeptide (TPR) repeat protein